MRVADALGVGEDLRVHHALGGLLGAVLVPVGLQAGTDARVAAGELLQEGVPAVDVGGQARVGRVGARVQLGLQLAQEVGPGLLARGQALFPQRLTARLEVASCSGV